jgi:hypothetical protein
MSTDTAAERFARDTGPHTREELLPYGASGPCRILPVRPHEMTVLHDDGLYRHLRFKSPDQGAYWFDLITWPGCLTVRGDLNTGYTFARVTDMFEFFRGKRINPHYWAEKLDADMNSVKAYSEDRFKQIVVDLLAEFAEQDPMLAQTAKSEILNDQDTYYEHGARSVLSEWERRGVFSDTWEWDLRDYDWSYLWACHAIVWGIAQYDGYLAARAELQLSEVGS